MTEPSTTIRKATRDDVDRIVRLCNAGGPEDRPRLELPDVLPNSYFTAFQNICSDSNQKLMVLECDGTVVGTFHLTFITYLAGAGRPDAQVELIHVAASHRGRGLGTLMLQWVIQEAKRNNCRRIQLTTDKRRAEAHEFYKRLGFEFTHEGAKLPL